MEWIIVVAVVVVLLVAIPLLRRPKDPMLSNTIDGGPVNVETQIDQLVQQGQKVRAIKVLRDATPGLGLEEAKRRIDNWQIRSDGAPATTPHATTTTSGATALPPAAIAEIDQLLADGKNIQAIKTLRDHTGLGLKDAKHRIDNWTPGRG